jgi:GTP-binding protein HflX
VLEVHNKIDLIPPAQRPLYMKEGDGDAVAVSAATGEGIGRLLSMIEARLFGAREELDLSLPSGEGELLAWLYRNAEVLDRHDHDDRVDLRVRLPDAARDRVLARCARYLSTAAAAAD